MPIQLGPLALKKPKPSPLARPKSGLGSPTSTPAPAPPGFDLASSLSQINAATPTAASLTGAARTAAGQDTSAMVNAYRGEQQGILGQASGRARQINQASLDAAAWLAKQNLGQGLESSLRASAGDQASLAAGYSGQLQQTVGDETARVQRGLDAIGGAGTAPNTSAAAGNVVYGLGGAIPASALLAAAPYARAQADQAPGLLAAYGNQQAIGALGAGRDAAAAYDPKIAEAIGGAPGLERKYLADYTKTAASTRQDAIGNLFKAVGVQQKGEALADARTVHADAIAGKNADRVLNAGYKQALIDAKAADREADRQWRNAQLAAKRDQLKVDAAYKQGQLDTASYNATTGRIRTQLEASKQAAELARPNAALSRVRGILVDGGGNPIPTRDGKPSYVAGWKAGPNGEPVKIATAKAKGQSSGKFSTSDVKALADDLSTWKTGLSGTANGVPQYGGEKLNWGQAYTRAAARLSNTPAGQKKALQLVNAEFGSPQKIAGATVLKGKQNGDTLIQAVQHVLEAQTGGQLPVPISYAVGALARAYGAPRKVVVDYLNDVARGVDMSTRSPAYG